MKTFKLTYYFYLNNGTKVVKPPMTVKNCMSDLHAKIRLEDYLKRHNSSFGNLVVTNCIEDFGNINNIFGGNQWMKNNF